MITHDCFLTYLHPRSTDKNALSQVPYALYRSGGNTIYFGLRNIYSTVNGGSFITYNNCGTGDCKNCEKAGSAALGLLLTSFFLTAIVVIFTILRAITEKAAFKFVNVILSFLVMIFSISGFGNWNQVCYMPLSKDYSIEHGNGYNIAVVGFFFMIIVFIIHLITPVESATAQSAEKTEAPANA